MFSLLRAAAVFCCLVPLSAHGWGPHSEITQAAIDVLPSDDPLRLELGSQVDHLREYCWMADWRRTLRREPSDWFYTDDYLLFPAMPSHVEHICPGVKKTYDPYFRRALQALRSESPTNAARWIGSLVHFTEDTGSPPHAAEVLGSIHSKMENWVDAQAIHIPSYQPRILGETEDAAVTAFQQRMEGLISFSKERFERAKPHVEAEDRAGTEPIVLESALECSRVVADLLHTLGALAAKPVPGGELHGHVVMPAVPGLEKMPAKILLTGTLYSTLAEPNGDFVFRHLPPGAYEVKALRGGPPALASKTIEEGKTTTVTLASSCSVSDHNLLRNPDFTVNWLGTCLADDWTPLHRKGEELHFESELVPLTSGTVYRLRVRWRAGATAPDQVLVHLQDKLGLQGLGTDLPPLAPGSEETSFTADAEHPFAQVFIYTRDLKRALAYIDFEPVAHVLEIDGHEHHLGFAEAPEWRDLASTPAEARFLNLNFQAHANTDSAILFIRQRDVKLTWVILLNGKKLGHLELNETPLVAHFEVPPRALIDGENTLTIASPEMPDDIFVRDILLDPRPPEQVLGECAVHVQVHDRQNSKGLPCRITVVDKSGALAPLIASASSPMSQRTGVVYSRDGKFELHLPHGSYVLYASRGPTWSRARAEINPGQNGKKEVSLNIEREVPTPGLVACDTHIHTFTFSHHGDASLDERMITLAGEGIELPIATDHNTFTDYRDAARAARVQAFFTPVIGTEVTTKVGHFNIFPTQRADVALPDYKLTSWPELFASMRGVPGVQVIVLNHPRDIHDGFTPFASENFNPVTGDNLHGPDYAFDAVEVANSGTLQSDFLLSFRDWFALLNHGYRVTAVGSSDCHDVSRFIVGQGRTYVATSSADPNSINVEQTCRQLKEGHALVSLGLLATLTLDNRFQPGDLATNLGPELHVHIQVLGPTWMSADHVALYANGVKIREQILPPSSAVEKAVLDWSIPKPVHDLYLVAIASGPGVKEPFWNIPFPYQPKDGVRDPHVLAATNPIWVDADGDGKFTSPRGYAEELVARYSNDPARLCSALAGYDPPTASQAASLLRTKRLNLNEDALTTALTHAQPSVRRGFTEYMAICRPQRR